MHNQSAKGQLRPETTNDTNTRDDQSSKTASMMRVPAAVFGPDRRSRAPHKSPWTWPPLPPWLA